MWFSKQTARTAFWNLNSIHGENCLENAQLLYWIKWFQRLEVPCSQLADPPEKAGFFQEVQECHCHRHRPFSILKLRLNFSTKTLNLIVARGVEFKQPWHTVSRRGWDWLYLLDSYVLSQSHLTYILVFTSFRVPNPLLWIVLSNFPAKTIPRGVNSWVLPLVPFQADEW